MLGANVGTTLIVQVLSFNVSAVAPLFFVVGVITFRAGGQSLTRALGRRRAATSLSNTAASVSPRVEAERRHLTVVSCDFVGLRDLATLLDPEELRNIIGACHARCSQVAARWDGMATTLHGVDHDLDGFFGELFCDFAATGAKEPRPSERWMDRRARTPSLCDKAA